MQLTFAGVDRWRMGLLRREHTLTTPGVHAIFCLYSMTTHSIVLELLSLAVTQDGELITPPFDDILSGTSVRRMFVLANELVGIGPSRGWTTGKK